MPDAPHPGIDLTRLNRKAGFLLRLSQLRVYEAFHASLSSLGMTPARYSLLAILHDNPDSRPGHIAEALRVKSSNMASLLTQLEHEGLIQRLPDPTERRAVLMRLTAAGETLFDRIDPIVRRLEEELLGALRPEERGVLLDQLARLAGLP